MDDVVAVVLGGGRGSRLFPLTQFRSKPAVPIAASYRLVDVAVSNCIHADLRRIFVITQYQSESLNRHVANTYKFDAFASGFIDLLAAEQTDNPNGDWFRGTADAVRLVATPGNAFSAPGPYCMQNAASFRPLLARAKPSAMPTPTRSCRHSTGRMSARAAASMSGVVG